jgi:hypothetical protein
VHATHHHSVASRSGGYPHLDPGGRDLLREHLAGTCSVGAVRGRRVTADPSGKPIILSGQRYLLITLRPAQAHGASGGSVTVS